MRISISDVGVRLSLTNASFPFSANAYTSSHVAQSRAVASIVTPRSASAS